MSVDKEEEEETQIPARIKRERSSRRSSAAVSTPASARRGSARRF